MRDIDTTAMVDAIRQRWASAPVAIYLFGSHARGDAHAESDVDIAVLAQQPMDALQRWGLQNDLADIAKCEVDLVDLKQASTVMQAQVLKDSVLLYDSQQPEHRHARDWFEMLVYSEYAYLNEKRRAIWHAIKERGSVYGKEA